VLSHHLQSRYSARTLQMLKMSMTIILPVILLLHALTQITAVIPTVAVGGQLSAGTTVAFSVAADKTPLKTTTGTFTVGFTTATEVPIGGFITIALPMGYIGTVDTSTGAKKLTANNGANAIASFLATCVRTGATVGTAVLGIASADQIVCTTEGAAIPAASVTSLIFPAGSFKVGLPQAAATYNVQTSVDLPLATAAATIAVGGQLSAGTTVAFSVAADKTPLKTTTGTFTVGFTTATLVPIGGFITIALPMGYIGTVDTSTGAKKLTANNGANAIASFLATCVRTGATVGTAVLGIASADQIVCTTEGADIPAASVTSLIFPAGSFKVGLPQAAATYNVQTSVDLPLATAAATIAVGGQLSAGTTVAFSVAADKTPLKTTTGTFTVGFTTATLVPIGGFITIALPMGYIGTVDTSTGAKKLTANNGANAIASFLATCVRTGATVGTAVLGIASADQIVCTTEGADIPAASVTSLIFPAGSFKVGLPQAAATYNVQTSVDLPLATAAATIAVGGQLSAGTTVAFSVAADKTPLKTTTGTFTVGFTTATLVPIGGFITIALPMGYIGTVDTSTGAKKLTANNGANAIASFLATCVRTGATVGTAVLGIASADQIVCTTEGADIPAASVTSLIFPAGSFKVGLPQAAATYNVQTSVDLPLATAAATIAVGGQLSAGTTVAFSVAADKTPLKTTTGTFTVGFTTATLVPIGGFITIALPMGYIGTVDTSTGAKKLTANNGANAIASFLATCVRTGATVGTAVLGIASADQIVCTTEGADIPAASVTSLIFPAGSFKVGLPQAAATYNVQTSVDLPLATAAATIAVGGQLSAGTTVAFSVAADKTPLKTTTGTFTVGFTTATLVPIGGFITIALPMGYIGTVDTSTSAKKLTATNGTVAIASFLATCVRTGATVGTAVLGIASADQIVCTTEGADIPAAHVTRLIFPAESFKVGLPQAAATYNVQTSVDLLVVASNSPSPVPAGPSQTPSSKSSSVTLRISFVLCLCYFATIAIGLM
jgi:hypothetical protein